LVKGKHETVDFGAGRDQQNNAEMVRIHVKLVQVYFRNDHGVFEVNPLEVPVQLVRQRLLDQLELVADDSPINVNTA
jgi:succinyl-CoA synthetase beta subunit